MISTIEAREITYFNVDQLLGLAVRDDQAHLVGRVGDDAYWSQADDDRQKQLPWCHPTAQAARAELFVAAMELHEAFAWAAKARCGFR